MGEAMQSPSLHFLHLSLQLKVFSLRFDYRRRVVKWALLRPAFAECKGGREHQRGTGPVQDIIMMHVSMCMLHRDDATLHGGGNDGEDDEGVVDDIRVCVLSNYNLFIDVVR